MVLLCSHQGCHIAPPLYGHALRGVGRANWHTAEFTLGNQHGACALQGPQYITEDLYQEDGKKNPGEQGYGSTPTRASLAFPTAVNHRSRTGRPVVVRAACMQVSMPPRCLPFVGCLNFATRCSALVVSSEAVACLRA